MTASPYTPRLSKASETPATTCCCLRREAKTTSSSLVQCQRNTSLTWQSRYVIPQLTPRVIAPTFGNNVAYFSALVVGS